jgi:hypothetical protein
VINADFTARGSPYRVARTFPSASICGYSIRLRAPPRSELFVNRQVEETLNVAGIGCVIALIDIRGKRRPSVEDIVYSEC